MLQVNVAQLHDDLCESLSLAWVAGREGGDPGFLGTFSIVSFTTEAAAMSRTPLLLSASRSISFGMVLMLPQRPRALAVAARTNVFLSFSSDQSIRVAA